MLVVESDRASAKLLLAVFAAKGCDARAVSDAGGALRAASEFRPETIFVKLDLERARGVTLATRLRAHPATENAVILGMTTNTEVFTAAIAIAAGCNVYLPIPFDTRTLAELVASHLALRTPREQRLGRDK